MNRYLSEYISKDLTRKMVFLAGPRQVGKTTVAKNLITKDDLYCSWDIPSDREKILRRTLPNNGILVLDEIHRFKSWRDYLKGLFDERGKNLQILVTGSARLDIYRFKGDSLQGRYHLLRLHPLSCAELKITNQAEFLRLLELGGFPEPYFENDLVFARRWSIEYRTRLISEEITSIEMISDLGKLELLALRLPELVGSPLSLNALREDLQVSHATVSRWVELLERFYAIVRLPPFGSPKIKAVKKEQKHYHFDWSVIPERAARFENMVALHLLKWVHFQRDTQGRDMDLCYFRDIDKREVDFIVTENRKPIMAIEVKLAATSIAPALKYFKGKFPAVRAIQVHCDGECEYVGKDGIEVMSGVRFLADLV